MNKYFTSMLVAAALAVLAHDTPLVAADNARELVAEAQRRTTSRSERYQGLLQSFKNGGKTSEKRWTFERLGSHGNSKSTIRFSAPSEVKGVALLIVNHPNKASDQWMWTPAIERDRRIAMQDRSTRFFGTDFSFEDLEERDVDHYEYAMLGDEAVDGAACWKIESTPKKTKGSQYSKSIVWLRKDNYVPERIEYFVKGELARRLNYGDIKNVQGVWTAHELVMTDVRTNTYTRLALEAVQYNLPFDDGDFTLKAIRK